MIAPFLALAFNPQAWIVVGLTALLSFSTGVVKGWNWSNADHLQNQVEALEKASEQKEKLAEDDRKRAEVAETELARSEATLESVLHESKMASCVLSAAELGSLQHLANRHRN